MQRLRPACLDYPAGQFFFFRFCNSQQLAEFLSYLATSGKVGSAGTLGNYRSAVNTAFMTVFNCKSLAESARVARAFREFASLQTPLSLGGQMIRPGIQVCSSSTGPTNPTTISSPQLSWLGSHGACLQLHAGPDVQMVLGWSGLPSSSIRGLI